MKELPRQKRNHLHSFLRQCDLVHLENVTFLVVVRLQVLMAVSSVVVELQLSLEPLGRDLHRRAT